MSLTYWPKKKEMSKLWMQIIFLKNLTNCLKLKLPGHFNLKLLFVSFNNWKVKLIKWDSLII